MLLNIRSCTTGQQSRVWPVGNLISGLQFQHASGFLLGAEVTTAIATASALPSVL